MGWNRITRGEMGWGEIKKWKKWDEMGWDGMRWDETENTKKWDEMGWDQTENTRSGMRWDEQLGWSGMRWDGRDEMGWDETENTRSGMRWDEQLGWTIGMSFETLWLWHTTWFSFFSKISTELASTHRFSHVIFELIYVSKFIIFFFANSFSYLLLVLIQKRLTLCFFNGGTKPPKYAHFCWSFSWKNTIF